MMGKQAGFQTCVKLWRATCFALAGLKSAWQGEVAFRIEVLFTMIVLPVAFWLGGSMEAVALRIFSWMGILVAELINTAVETVVNRISQENHPLSKRAKDVAGAAVFLSIINMLVIWILLFPF